MPSSVVSSRLMSESIGNGRFFSSSLVLRHAWCTYSLSVETPSSWASRALNSLSSLPNAAISVGHTKVKSFGQKNTTRHLPLWVLASNCWKALAWSFETTPVSEYCGNFLPIPNMNTPFYDSLAAATGPTLFEEGIQALAGMTGILPGNPHSGQSIDWINSIENIYGRPQAQGPALPRGRGRHAPFQPRGRTQL